MINKKTLVIGGSPKPTRYSNKAIRKLLSYGHSVESIGLRKSSIESVNISINKPKFEDIHTVTLYIGSVHQPDYYSYLLSLNPSRIIFNPGTENHEFAELANKNGIEVIENCTLVMLNDGLF
ncbi:MAG: CoA-binding protein [Bacteroidetes bacterium]|nr:CoA-binding protein [Bacteroidota bacterium]